MATINIAGMTPVDDPSYRYKMPKVIGKVEGRGNGIKTVLANVIELGLSLNREAPEITKFFGCELGSQTTYDVNTDRAIVNGAHIDNDLQKSLCRYIENFVLCKNCRLPETHYKIKDGMISQKCLACGSKEGVDMAHKLTAFILAQHKKAKEVKREAEKAAEKAEKKANKGKKEKSSKDKEGGEESKEGESPEEKKEKKDKKEKKEKKEKKDKKDGESSPTSPTVFTLAEGEAAAEDEEEGEDMSESKAADEAMERYKFWTDLNSSATTAQIVDELRVIQTTAALRPADRPILFLGAMFTEEAVSKCEVAKYREILAALAPSAIQERHLIAAFEWLCGRKYPKILKHFPVLLKHLLDEELVEEFSFFQWHQDLARNEYSADVSMMDLDTLENLKDSAMPFITWLQEAESEEDDDDEEEGEGEDED